MKPVDHPSVSTEQSAVRDAPTCYLQWRGKSAYIDGKEGLFHQLASLGVAFAEAHNLRRTFVLPTDEFCIPSKHSAMGTLETSIGQHRRACRAWEELFDLPLLSHFGIRLTKPAQVPAYLFRPLGAGAANFSWADDTRLAAARYPCGPDARLITRLTRGYWFMHSRYVNAAELRRELFANIGAPLQCTDSWIVEIHRHWSTNYLRSGLFYAPHIKAAAAAIVRAMGMPYMAVHLRRGDRLTDAHLTSSSRESRENMTRAIELRSALIASFPPGVPVYVGSTEPLAFFSPLRSAPFEIFFASNFTNVFEAHGINDNIALFAVESLVFLGAAKLLETFASLLAPFFEACFPAVATEATAREVCDDDGVLLGSKACTTRKHGVQFGAACVRRPECTMVPRSCPRVAPRHNTTYDPICPRKGPRHDRRLPHGR